MLCRLRRFALLVPVLVLVGCADLSEEPGVADPSSEGEEGEASSSSSDALTVTAAFGCVLTARMPTYQTGGGGTVLGSVTYACVPGPARRISTTLAMSYTRLPGGDGGAMSFGEREKSIGSRASNATLHAPPGRVTESGDVRQCWWTEAHVAIESGWGGKRKSTVATSPKLCFTGKRPIG